MRVPIDVQKNKVQQRSSGTLNLQGFSERL
jgi:hypothetical protein